jgi:Resolvase, N terminal domain
VPEPAASLLTHYAGVVRPRLKVQDGLDARRFWLTENGTPYEHGSLGVWIKQLTFRLMGRAICSHDFRYCAATTMALSPATEAREIRSLLGQASDRTSERRCNQAGAIEARAAAGHRLDPSEGRKDFEEERLTMRAAFHARCSFDHQSVASIPDQVRLCRRLCEEQGWSVVDLFGDVAFNGATPLRPGFHEMQRQAMVNSFDVLGCEALDRLSRGEEHIARL